MSERGEKRRRRVDALALTRCTIELALSQPPHTQKRRALSGALSIQVSFSVLVRSRSAQGEGTRSGKRSARDRGGRFFFQLLALSHLFRDVS